VKIVELSFLVSLAVPFILSGNCNGQDEPWQAMDYGPFLSAAIEVTSDNIACKGIAIPLDEGGEHAMLFDTAELRWAAAWRGEFVELRGIVYDGPHGIWPRIAGTPDWINPSGPGIAVGKGGTFKETRQVPFGPIQTGRWQGLQRDRDGVLLHYTVGKTKIFERAGFTRGEEIHSWKRSLQFIGLDDLLKLSVMTLTDGMVLSPSPGGPRGEYLLIRGGRPVMVLYFQGGGRDRRIASQEGRVIVEVKPSEKDPGPLHIYIAPITGREQLVSFRAITERVYLRDPSPLAAVWGKGSGARWNQSITLAGERDALFGEGDEAQLIVRGSGAGAEMIELPHQPGDIPELYGMNGVSSVQSSASATESVVVVRRVNEAIPSPVAGWNCDESSGELMTNLVDGEKDLKLEGVTWRRGVKGRSLDFDGTARAIWTRHDNFEFTDSPFTFAAWVHTTKDGTIFSQTAEQGRWIHDGKTFFIRDGHLCFDIGWVGVISGEQEISDGSWHHVAFTWDPSGSRVELFVDGEEDGEGVLTPSGPVENTVMQIGFTAENFPEDSWFSGYIDGIRIYKEVFQSQQIKAIAEVSGEPIIDAYGLRGDLDGRFIVVESADISSVIPAWQRKVNLLLSATEEEAQGELLEWHGPLSRIGEFTSLLQSRDTPTAQHPFQMDRITWPDENPWNSWMRFGDFDFLDGGASAAISTWNGDVWRVDGLDDSLDELRWQRIASGLSQPLGLLTRGEGDEEEILVLGRDQITRLNDIDGDGETDHYEAFNADAMNSPHFHEPAGGLQEGSDGNIYYLKAARHAKLPAHPRHGTLIQVSSDGSTSKIVASGFRAPNGVAVDSDGIAWGSDQEGHWMPANRINRIAPGSFHGNNWSGVMLGIDEMRTEYDPPLCWIHPTVDRSPAAQVRVPEGVWGDLSGKLLGVSYGTGEVYLLLEDEVDGVHQGGFVPLPIETPTGTMRGRFHPDGSLYLSGLFGWSSDKTEPGGFYRVRKTQARLPLPVHLRALQDGLLITFNEKISTEPAALASAFQLEGWNYHWSSNYGSPRLDLRDGSDGTTELEVLSAKLSDDGTQVQLKISDMTVAMQMHLKWDLEFEEVGSAESFIHFTVHKLATEVGRGL